jgi:catechol 2,3-dioxygenase-like lactoylglutathione lyase family enzyme
MVRMGLDLLVLRCSDMDAAKRFYECLGMSFTRHTHGSGPEHYAHEGGDLVLELYPVAGSKAPDCAGLGFSVDDLAAVALCLRDAGFAPGDVSEQPWGTTFVVRDADDRRVEIRAHAGS